MNNWKRWISWPLAAILFCGAMALVMRAQEVPQGGKAQPQVDLTQLIDVRDGRAQEPKPTPPKPPTIEDLQKAVTDKDQQIAQLQQQIAGLNGNLSALNKLYGACYQQLSADEAQLAAKK
jgi:TolA-binding protein